MGEAIWQALAEAGKAAEGRRITALFERNPDRFREFSVSLGDMLLDFSKTNIDAQALTLLIQLAESCGVPERRDAMFNGLPINVTEGRSVLHIALRNRSNRPILVDGKNVMPEVNDVLARMGAFATGIRKGTIAASDGKPFTDIVNIGIGGSDLGPVMATLALAPYHDGPRAHFVSNVDGAHIHDVLAGARSGADAGDRRLQDLHHHRDHDQRPHRAGLAAGGAAGARRTGTSRRSRPRSTRPRRSGSTPSGCSGSGTGSAGAIRSGARSGCR